MLVDCADDGTYLIDTAAVEAAMTPRTKAIVPVHLYGQAAPWKLLMPIAERAGAWIVEDAAQSQGARRNGAGAGDTWSCRGHQLLPGKNLGAYGDAGAVLTDSAEVAARMRMIRDHGRRASTSTKCSGSTAEWTRCRLSCCRRNCAAWTSGTLPGGRPRPGTTRCCPGCDDVVLPRTLRGNEHVWHLYVVRVPDRDRVLKELHAAGIGSRNPLSRAGSSHRARSPGSVTRRAHSPSPSRRQREILSLPLFAEITQEQQERVVSVLIAALK